jgi:hypothetical protein
MMQMGEQIDAWEAALRELDRALCNFINAACDPWQPDKWAEETERNFGRLVDAYHAAHECRLLRAGHEKLPIIMAARSALNQTKQGQ